MGGLTIAQGSNLSRPRFSDIPRSAVAAGFVDIVLPVEDIPQRLLAYVRNFGAFEPEPSDALSKIYALLRSRTGHDFSQYKDQTFRRRVQRRMQVVQTARLDDYVHQAQKETDEVGALFRDLLIGAPISSATPALLRH
jgi:two-component system, chemotaxis family, CheB/CheR fusion protein